MKITNVFDATFISVKKTSYLDKDGRQVYANYIAMECNGDVGNVQCTDVVMQELEKEVKYSEMKFQAVYDSYQKSLVVIGYCLKEKKDPINK